MYLQNNAVFANESNGRKKITIRKERKEVVIQIRRRLFFHVVSVVTALIMVLSVFGMNVFAVTGSQVAADGTYSGYSSEGTVTVTVSNGKIAGVSANVKSKYQG